jgi:hypothetical protein
VLKKWNAHPFHARKSSFDNVLSRYIKSFYSMFYLTISLATNTMDGKLTT